MFIAFADPNDPGPTPTPHYTGSPFVDGITEHSDDDEAYRCDEEAYFE